MKIVTIRSYIPGIVMLAVATVLFCIPGNQMLRDDWLSRIHFDKWVHVGLFAVLVSLWCLPVIARRTLAIFAGGHNAVAPPSGKGSYKSTGSRGLAGKLAIVVVSAIAYGVAIEFIQEAFIPNRGLSIGDMVADSIGSVVGALFAWSQRRPV